MIIKSRLKKDIKAVVYLPASKSESNRGLTLKALTPYVDLDFSIDNLSDAEDTRVLNKLLFGDLESNSNLYNVGHAGTAMRFLTAYLAIKKDSKVILTGSDRMKERPIEILVEALIGIGADIHYLNKKGYPPIEIKGKNLLGGVVSIDSTVSSQYLSALLMIAPCLKNGLELHLKGKLVSKPYLDMTIDLMNSFGVDVGEEGNKYIVKPQIYKPASIRIESDWSAASYWYEIAALSKSCEIELRGLNKKSRQGDQELIQIFRIFGVETSWNEDGVVLSKSADTKLNYEKKYRFNLERTPDLAQAIICACAGLGLDAFFSGLSTLKIKETDRLLALKSELKKFNVELELIGNDKAELLNFNKITKPKIPVLTYQDHRMAMAFAPLALVVGEVQVKDSDVVKKSYPNFWNDLDLVFDVVI